METVKPVGRTIRRPGVAAPVKEQRKRRREETLPAAGEKGRQTVEIKLGTQRELDRWMELVDKVKDAFPGLETPEALAAHRNTAQAFMRRQEAVCAVEGGRVVGALLFSTEKNALCFLAVDPSFRRRRIAADMVAFMLPRMDSERAITVTTYREGDLAGIAARAFYRSLGFAEGKLGESFGSPVQEFVMKPKRRPEA